MSDRILIIDFGSQVTQLIARRVRESGVYSEVHPFNKVTQQSILDFDPNGIILSGGPASVTDIDTPRAPDEIFDMDLPILGICYGQQTMVEQMGGKVAGSEEKEFGRAIVTVTDDCELFHGVWDVGNEEQVWMSHGDRVEMLPDGFRIVGTSENAPYAAIAHDEKKFYAVQFHPEVDQTPHGAQLLENFTHRVAGCGGDWTMAAFRASALYLAAPFNSRGRGAEHRGRIIGTYYFIDCYFIDHFRDSWPAPETEQHKIMLC